MKFRMVKRTSPLPKVMAVGVAILSLGGIVVTAAEAAAPAQVRSPREAAPFDLTGYWTAVVSEDWRWRMVTPAKGDFASLPLNDEGVKVGNEWDPAKDAAAGAQCKAFGAGGIMRMPTRLHITWQDDLTLKVETDHGQQTRLFRFAAPRPAPAAGGGGGGPPALPPLNPAPVAGAASLQGNTVARWNVNTLEGATNNLLAGYLRRNGAPYSENAIVFEYWTQHTDFGDTWLTITTVVRDPKYLRQEMITSSSFKKLPDASKWTPLPCDKA
ncbi:MAG: hypothetical protein ABL964_04790 [Steroidobacteraceae bacterium]